jgi:hypothetical protein
VDLLAGFLADPPPGRKSTKRIHVVEVQDPKTKQSLVVESDEQIAAYVIDVESAKWATGERHPEGILVGACGGEDWVVFIELKGTFRPKPNKELPTKHALDQLEGAVRHFHPIGRRTNEVSYGAAHHDQWANGADELEVLPGKGHRVLGIALAFRQVPRPPPTRDVTVSDSDIPLRTAQVSMTSANQATVTFRDLLYLAGALDKKKRR